MFWTSALPLFVVGSLAAVATALQPATVRSQAPPRVEPVAAPGGDVVVALPVEGLTELNRRDVVRALESWTVDVTFCPRCNGPMAGPGRCDGCGEVTHEQKLRLVRTAEATRRRGGQGDEWLLSLVLAPGARVSLAGVERLLGSGKVVPRREDLELAGDLVLVFQGATAAGDARVVQEALRVAGVFEREVASFDEGVLEVHVRTLAGASPPRLETVADVVRARAPGLRLADVIWSAPYAVPVTPASAVEG